MSIKRFPPLFKFRNVDDNTLNCIENNQIWFADVDQLNDPFELFYKVELGLNTDNIEVMFDLMVDLGENPQKYNRIDIARNEQEIMLAKIYRDIIRNLDQNQKELVAEGIHTELELLSENTLKELKKNTKVFCCSTIDSHPLLWGHYADGMRGICIEYDFNNQARSPYFGFCDIKYKERPLTINVNDFIRNNEHLDDFSIDIFGTKNTAWSYEKEFRLIATNQHWNGNLYTLSKGVMKSITIGEFIDKKSLSNLLDTVRGKDIQLKIAIAEREFFRTKTIPYDDSFFIDR